MDVAHVERVVVRAEFLPEPGGRIEVAGRIHIVVVVSYGMENLKSLDDVYVFQILVKAVSIGVPVQVPGHISESKGIDLCSRIGFHILIDFGSES